MSEAELIAAPVSLSIWELFFQAGIVVKLVMFGLLAASLWCWAIIFSKILLLKRLHQSAAQFEEEFWSGQSLEQLYQRIKGRVRDPLSAVFAAAMQEWNQSLGTGKRATLGTLRVSLLQRIDRAMNTTLASELDKIEKHMGFLASTGSTAPFVGLFGTVWGIMTSFQAISVSKNTSLAVVAPGIAEALFATAIGLVAAIPAVIAYNKLSLEFGRYASRLEGFTAELEALISRQLDFMEGQGGDSA